MAFFKGLRAWLGSSVDSRTVGALLRWVGFLYHPLDDRLRPGEAIARAWRRPIYRGVGWMHVFGPAALFLVFVLAGTGILLSFHYEAHPETAHTSVLEITAELPAGWLVRGTHHWAAELLVVLVAVHVLRAFFSRAFRAPRQANWVVGLLVLPVVLSLHFTGTLLPWDQAAYWNGARALRPGTGIGIIGAFLGRFADGTDLSNAALGRAFALHVILLPWTLFFLLSTHLRLVWRHGLTPPVPPRGGEPPNESMLAVLRVDATQAEVAVLRAQIEAENVQLRQEALEGRAVFHIEGCRSELAATLSRDPRVKEVVAISPGPAGRTFFPNHFLRILGTNLVMAGALVLLSAWLPPPINGAPDQFHRIASTTRPWYVLWFHGLEDLVPPTLSVLVTAGLWLVVIVALIWPMLDTHFDGRPKRPYLTPAIGIALLFGLVALSIHGAGLS